MTQPERWLWNTAAVEVDLDERVPADEVLLAFRAGRLSAFETRHVERQLAHNGAARARLIELAAIPAIAPDARTRLRVLDGSSQGRLRSQAAARPRRLPYAAAAAAVLIAGVWLGSWALRNDGAAIPADLEFAVSVVALADVRGDAATPLADPETRVRVAVASTSRAAAGLDFALYRHDAGRLRRLGPDDGLTVESGRGAAELTVRAGRLVDPVAGEQAFFVVVAPTGRADASIDVARDEAPEAALARETAGRVYRRTLEIRDASAPEVN